MLRTPFHPRTWLLVALLAAGAFVIQGTDPTPALAQTKSKKKPSAKKSAAKNKKAKEKKAKEPAAEAPAPEAKKDDPFARAGAATFKVESALDQKQIDRSKAADQKRDEAIEELKKLIPKAPASRKAEMIFRLAELYWEKSKYKYGLGMQEYEKDYQQWNDSGRKSKEPNRAQFVRESELIKVNALKLYEKVLGEYPTYERNDEVLFYLGYNEYEAGNHKKAVSHYWTLIKRFPQSGLVPNAYLQLGEHFFGANDVLKARKAYERALASNAGSVYNYALYKLSWCDYNVQEYAEGIKKLKEVIEKSEKATDTKSVQLKGEALGDLTRFFSYVDETDSAFDYFKKKGGEELAIRYTAKLGELFHEQGKWELEIHTFKMLNNKYPMNARAPVHQASIVTAYSKMNDKEKVRQEVERLVDLYRPGTPWYKTQEKSGDKASLEFAYDLTETHLRDLVTEYHRDAQKRKDVPTYVLARDIYKKYLDAFNATESAYQMRYFYAEVLWALEEWKESAGQYDAIARDEKEGTKGKYARMASYNTILAYEKMIDCKCDKGVVDQSKKIDETKSKGETKKIVAIREVDKSKKYEERPIPEVQQKLGEACDLYFAIADQKDEELPKVKFKAAYIFYDHNHFVESAKRFAEIIERWPNTDMARKSAGLTLDSLNVQEQWDALEKYARIFRDNKKLLGKDKEFSEFVQEMVEGSSFKSIMAANDKARTISEEEAKKSELAKVATRFRGFQKEFEESRFSPIAMFNALTIYDQADELDHAIEAAELLLAKYNKPAPAKKGKSPAKATAAQKAAEDLAAKNKVFEKTHFMLAGFYERIANFSKAAELYNGYYETFKDTSNASDALYNAALYNQGMGNSEKAIALYTKYSDEFKSKPDAAEVYWRICEIYDADLAYKKAIECWGKYRDRYKNATPDKVFATHYKVAMDHEALKDKKAAMKEYEWLVKNFSSLKKEARESPLAKLAAGRAAFELLEPEFVRYQGIKVTLNKKSLLEKANKAEELACIDSGANKCKKQGKFVGILEYGSGEYGIAALTRIGMIFRDFANKIREAPVPRNLDEDQREIYVSELDALALGPEEKSIEAFELALQKAYELNIYSEWTILSQENLRQLNPNKFPDPQKASVRGAEGFITASIKQKGEARSAPPPAEGEGQEAADETAEDAEAEDGTRGAQAKAGAES